MASSPSNPMGYRGAMGTIVPAESSKSIGYTYIREPIETVGQVDIAGSRKTRLLGAPLRGSTYCALTFSPVIH
jgi:hypothetical protein